MFSCDGWNNLNCKYFIYTYPLIFLYDNVNLDIFYYHIDSLEEFRRPEKKLLLSNLLSTIIVTILCKN